MSSYPFDEDDDDYFEQEQAAKYNLKECTIYAIDCRPSMFIKTELGEIPFLTALKSIQTKLLDTLYTRPNDQMGIILIHTEMSQNALNKEHIYVLQPLDIPDAPRLKELASMHDLALFKQHYGSSDVLFPLSDFLAICGDMMTNAPKFAMKRIILITDDDDPTGQNPNYRKITLQKAKDLTQVGIEPVVFGLDQPHHPFDKTLFYQDMVNFNTKLEDDFEHQLVSSTSKVTDLFDKIKSFQATTRSEFSIPLHLAPHLTIGIKGFNMVIEKKAESPQYFCTSGEQLKEVKAVTRWQCVDTHEYLTPIDIRKSYLYGDEKVILTEQEVTRIKTVNEPGLLILGYRSQASLKSYHQISHPYFIYPDESQYKESKRIFCLLLKVLSEKKQLAVCSFVRKVNTTPKMVALLPQLETLDKDGNQLDPPGFQLIILPYADEIRPVPPFEVAQDYEQGIEKAKRLIDKLKITEGYQPMAYPNPFLQNHKYMVQKVALETTAEPIDRTIPNFPWIESALSDDIQDFKQSVGLDLISAEAWLDTKRKNNDSEPNDKIKRKKTDMTIQEHWQAGTLASVTNVSLKAFLTDADISPKKKKAELVEQVEDYFRSQQLH